MIEALELEAARWELHLTTPDQLSRAGVDALSDGVDSPSLRLLAALTSAELDEAPRLLVGAFDELGRSWPTTTEAIRRVTRDHCRRLVEGVITPYEAAKEVARAARCSDEPLPDLDTFTYAASEWDERPEDANVFAEGVVAAARALLS